MTDARQAAISLAVIRELQAQLKQVAAELAEDLDGQMDEGDTIAAVLPDRTKLGKATKVSGRQSIYVQDEHDLMVWVKENYPHEIVESIRPSFIAHLIDKAKRTGELTPGLDVKWGDPYIRFTTESGAREVIAARWRELVGEKLWMERWEIEGREPGAA